MSINVYNLDAVKRILNPLKHYDKVILDDFAKNFMAEFKVKIKRNDDWAFRRNRKYRLAKWLLPNLYFCSVRKLLNKNNMNIWVYGNEQEVELLTERAKKFNEKYPNLDIRISHMELRPMDYIG